MHIRCYECKRRKIAMWNVKMSLPLNAIAMASEYMQCTFRMCILWASSGFNDLVRFVDFNQIG